jgi:hypothetical protein
VKDRWKRVRGQTCPYILQEGSSVSYA